MTTVSVKGLLGAIEIVDLGKFLGIGPLINGSERISFRVGLFDGSKTKIFKIKFFALSEMATFYGKEKLPALIFLYVDLTSGV